MRMVEVHEGFTHEGKKYEAGHRYIAEDVEGTYARRYISKHGERVRFCIETIQQSL